jgi:hypothetical protein
MYTGTVKFQAHIKGNGLKFPLCEFNPGELGLTVEIECPDGVECEYRSLSATREDGKLLAMKVNTAALNRISFMHNIAIEVMLAVACSMNPPPETISWRMVTITEPLQVDSRMPESLKTELEQTSPPGEHDYGSFVQLGNR